jgi:hypothetical protein
VYEREEMTMAEKSKPFFWYELMTTDPKKAAEF